MFEDLVESYHLDSQIKDDFQCDQDCYIQNSEPTKDDHLNICTHNYQHIAQNIDDLSDNTQQNNLYSSEESTSSFTDGMVPTGTLNQGKPGKMGRHFPVREKSGNFVKTGKVRNFAQNTGKTGKFE